MTINNPVIDYTLLFDSVTGLYAKSNESISNVISASTVLNSFGLAIHADSTLNSDLHLSADSSLADEVTFTVSSSVGSNEEVQDFVGGEGLNQLVTSVIDFGQFMADNIDDINTIIDEGVTEMQGKIIITAKAPVVKTGYKPATKVLPKDIVTR